MAAREKRGEKERSTSSPLPFFILFPFLTVFFSTRFCGFPKQCGHVQDTTRRSVLPPSHFFEQLLSLFFFHKFFAAKIGSVLAGVKVLNRMVNMTK
jgi:hypothetical protein